MQFSSTLVQGRLLKRYKRFLADVELSNGEQVTAHCANPGSMLGLKEPGSVVWLSISDNPKRKLQYSWELIESDLGSGPSLVGINTSHPNRIVSEAIDTKKIRKLSGYGSQRGEVKYGENSRIDILLEDESKPPCYLEIKNVHLMRKPGLAEFPDSVTARGAKHLNELEKMVRRGFRSAMLFLIQREDAKRFKLARDIDPAYGAAFDQAMAGGVEMLCYDCSITTENINLRKAVPIKF